MIDWEEEERFDKYKTRIFKFVLYKPRTEKEVYYKFKSFENSELYLERVIEILKELKYIDDRRYAEMYIEDSLNIKRLSRFELKNIISLMVLQNLLFLYYILKFPFSYSPYYTYLYSFHTYLLYLVVLLYFLFLPAL